MRLSWKYADLPRTFHNNSLRKSWGANRVHYEELENTEQERLPVRVQCHVFSFTSRQGICLYYFAIFDIFIQWEYRNYTQQNEVFESILLYVSRQKKFNQKRFLPPPPVFTLLQILQQSETVLYKKIVRSPLFCNVKCNNIIVSYI